jgi:hypothetical protein
MDDTPETFPQAVLDALTDHLVVVAHTNITPRKRAEGKTAALMDALAAHLQSLIRLHEVSTRFVRNGDAPEFLGQVLETAMAVTGADFGTIQLLDPQKRDARHRRAARLLGGVAGLTTGVDAHGTAGRDHRPEPSGGHRRDADLPVQLRGD